MISADEHAYLCAGIYCVSNSEPCIAIKQDSVEKVAFASSVESCNSYNS